VVHTGAEFWDQFFRQRLQDHPAGTLTGMDRYLHQRTGGMIGSLSHLIRGAAIEAILDGSEKITRKLLDAVDLDHAAQQAITHLKEALEAMQPGIAARPARSWMLSNS
jgi:hypothetical protein